MTVNKTGNLDTSVFGQICYEVTCVKNITADLVGFVCDNRLHNVRSIFKTAGVLFDTRFKNVFIIIFPTFDLVYATTRVFVKRNVIFFNKFRVF